MTYKRKPTHMRGMGACVGEVTGRVHYIPWYGPGIMTPRRRAAIDTIQEGDVIITRMTTPEIMPFIKKVAGIVTEVGGIVCHAAIIAREYNIPTVLACPGIATKIRLRRLPTIVTLNGATGEVVLDGEN